MQIMISRERLREKIKDSPDLDTEAGYAIGALEEIGMFISPEVSPVSASSADQLRMKEAFCVFVRQLRRRENLSVSELSQKARVDEDEVRKIEHDPQHRPRPRTVHQLAQVFKIPERAFMKLSGATITKNSAFQEGAIRFAAKSDDMAKLSSSEQKALNEYIRFLATHNGD